MVICLLEKFSQTFYFIKLVIQNLLDVTVLFYNIPHKMQPSMKLFST